MNKKWIFAGFAWVILSAGVFILVTKNSHSPENSSLEQVPQLSGQPEVSDPTEALLAPISKPDNLPAPVPPPVDRTPKVKEYSAKELKQRTELAEIKQNEIKSLMEEYDDNLSNIDKRKEIQNKIDDLMKEYNEIILPVAIAKVKESNS